MLNEGSVHGVDVTKALSNYGTTGSANAWKVDVSNIVSLHMDEEVPEKGPTAMLTIINDTNTHTSTSYDMTCTSIASMLQQYVTSHTSSAKSCVSPYGTLLHATRSIIQSRSSESEYMHRVLMVLAGLNIVRKLFYEAQVCIRLYSFWLCCSLKRNLLHHYLNSCCVWSPFIRLPKSSTVLQSCSLTAWRAQCLR